MKKLVAIIIMVLALPTITMAGPFLVCDPQTGVTHYKITGMGGTEISSPATATGAMRHDLASLSPGSYNIGVVACTKFTEEVWGEACSTATPFQFTKPYVVAPALPANVKLSK